jgi:hypothetical protein
LLGAVLAIVLFIAALIAQIGSGSTTSTGQPQSGPMPLAFGFVPTPTDAKYAMSAPTIVNCPGSTISGGSSELRAVLTSSGSNIIHLTFPGTGGQPDFVMTGPVDSTGRVTLANMGLTTTLAFAPDGKSATGTEVEPQSGCPSGAGSVHMNITLTLTNGKLQLPSTQSPPTSGGVTSAPASPGKGGSALPLVLLIVGAGVAVATGAAATRKKTVVEPPPTVSIERQPELHAPAATGMPCGFSEGWSIMLKWEQGVAFSRLGLLGPSESRASELARQYLQNRLNIESHQIADFYDSWSKSFSCAAPCVVKITMSETDIYWEEPPVVRDGMVVRYMRKSFDCVVDCVPAG